VSPRASTATAIVAALLAGAGAYAIWRGTSGPSGQPTPAASAPAVGSQLVSALPAFSLADRTGQARTLQDWQGKSLIVNFWATWCAPCRREIPLLQELQRDHGPQGFQVVGIAVDERDKVIAYADEMQIAYPLLIGEQDALDAITAFGIDAIGFPFTVFADRQGRVITAHMGELTAAQAGVILAAIRRVDSGADTVAQAQSAIRSGLTALDHGD
jgi:thiol-disulfide isomerase/thioredoxin